MKQILCILSIVFLPLVVSAQNTALPILNTGALTIDLNPSFPQPNTSFTATLNDHALPVRATNINWFINGEIVSDKQNIRTLELISPDAGETMNISVSLDLANGTTLEARNIITPAYLDIIIEPQTRTPAFYLGRPLPSIGSTINATAIVNGNVNTIRDYIYTWRINGTVLEGGAIRGRNTISFPMPRGEHSSLGLEVQRPGGEVVARRLIRVSSHSPQIHFYEINSLYGMHERAIAGNLVLSGISAVVRAEPYYLDLEIYNEPSLAEWEIDNVEQPRQFINPYEITFTALAVQRQSTISFVVRDTTQVLQGANADFLITTN